MHADKARELFSAYLEGKLDPALRESLGRKLASDPKLREEYESFAATYRALQSLGSPAEEPAFDLHDRVMARIDRYAWEKARAKEPWFRNWRTALAGGLAALALLSAGVSLMQRGGAPSASLAGTPAVEDRLYVRSDGDEAVVAFQTFGRKTVVVREVNQGRELARVEMDGTAYPMGQLFRSPIRVRMDQPSLVQVVVEGREDPLLVAVPGRKASLPREGRGSIQDLALALADRYRVPVVVSTRTDKTDFVWKLGNPDSVAAATDALRETALAAEMRPTGVLWIQ